VSLPSEHEAPQVDIGYVDLGIGRIGRHLAEGGRSTPAESEVEDFALEKIDYSSRAHLRDLHLNCLSTRDEAGERKQRKQS